MTEDEIILTHILQCSRSQWLIHKPILTKTQQRQYDQCRARRKQGEPLQYILGVTEFYGLEFEVSPAVLVPRPETERLVEEAVKFLAKLPGEARILDIGTGSGNIAVTLAKNIPSARIVALDVSQDALTVAKHNAQCHGVSHQIQFEKPGTATGFYLEKPVAVPGFHLIISNPPYVPSAQIRSLPVDVQREPVLALDGGKDGLKFYRNIIKYTPSLLSREGCLMMEFGDGQAAAIAALAGKHFAHIAIHKDLTGKERIIICH